jgi:hypothetical protein
MRLLYSKRYGKRLFFALGFLRRAWRKSPGFGVQVFVRKSRAIVSPPHW